MKRELQRNLRGWRAEFASFWKRFNAFQRIVIGIVLAMTLVYGARVRLLDPLSGELETARAALAERGVPGRVPPADRDDETQQALLRAENMAQSLAEELLELEAFKSGTRYRLEAGPADAQAALVELATRAGLRVQENRAAPAGEAAGGREGFPAAAFTWELRGSFEAVSKFISAFPLEPYLWEIDRLALVLLEEGAPVSPRRSETPAPVLSLRFIMRFFLYEGES